MSREDALAIKAYLFSLPAVHRAPPPNSLTFPFNQRWAMRFWNIAFLRDRRFEPDPSKPPEVNRGAYLVEVLGHCGECHTPRNAAFALKSSERLAGANLQGWNAYNITDDALHGIGAWSHEQLQSYLWHGHAEGRGAASGQMAEAVENSLQYLSAEDVRAMVAYLRTVPPKANDLAAPVEPNPPALSAMSGSSLSGDTPPALGRRIFEGACASCHQWNGTGLQTRYAALRGSQTVNDPHGVNLVQVILRGTSIRTAQESASMPGFAGSFSDAEVAAVANFVIDRFGAKEGRVTPEDVARSRNE
jgi:mono/diheme cytochrome c family protein